MGRSWVTDRFGVSCDVGLVELALRRNPKRAQLLKELVPQLSRLAFLWNRNNASHLAYLDEPNEQEPNSAAKTGD